jgi:serine/threonine-protein kinase/endoribonuclease IRE1
MSSFWSNIFCWCNDTEEVPVRRSGSRNVNSVRSLNQSLISRAIQTSPNSNVAILHPRRSANEVQASSVIPQRVIATRPVPKTGRLNEQEFLLSHNPKITFMNNKNLVDQNKSVVFYGTFGERPVSVKRIAGVNKLAEIEFEILSRIESHENIIRLWCRLKDEEFIYFVLDFYQISLRTYVIKGQSVLTKPKEVFRQLTSAVTHLHRLKILYLNFNPENVKVITYNGETNIKLTNFEYSRTLTRDKKIRNAERYREFSAPETFCYGEAYLGSDIYSLGCLFFFVITKGNEVPVLYEEALEVQITAQLHKANAISPTCDTILISALMRSMLKYDINARFTIAQVGEHPYFWSAHEIFDLVMDVAKKLEQNEHKKQLTTKLQSKKKLVIGKNWITRIEKEVYDDLCQAREYDGNNVGQLVRAIRNQFCHNNKVTHITGSTKEELKSYWCDKFPHLIPHLYSSL